MKKNEIVIVYCIINYKKVLKCHMLDMDKVKLKIRYGS